MIANKYGGMFQEGKNSMVKKPEEREYRIS